jgi:hypothetical protein
LSAVRELLEHHPVCFEIARYLVGHSEAADTARGVAEWWIRRDMAATEAALLRLVACGVVRSSTVQGTTSVYAYTRDLALRQVVAECVRASERPF